MIAPVQISDAVLPKMAMQPRTNSGGFRNTLLETVIAASNAITDSQAKISGSPSANKTSQVSGSKPIKAKAAVKQAINSSPSTSQPEKEPSESQPVAVAPNVSAPVPEPAQQNGANPEAASDSGKLAEAAAETATVQAASLAVGSNVGLLAEPTIFQQPTGGGAHQPATLQDSGSNVIDRRETSAEVSSEDPTHATKIGSAAQLATVEFPSAPASPINPQATPSTGTNQIASKMDPGRSESAPNFAKQMPADDFAREWNRLSFRSGEATPSGAHGPAQKATSIGRTNAVPSTGWAQVEEPALPQAQVTAPDTGNGNDSKGVTPDESANVSDPSQVSPTDFAQLRNQFAFNSTARTVAVAGTPDAASVETGKTTSDQQALAEQSAVRMQAQASPLPDTAAKSGDVASPADTTSQNCKGAASTSTPVPVPRNFITSLKETPLPKVEESPSSPAQSLAMGNKTTVVPDFKKTAKSASTEGHANTPDQSGKAQERTKAAEGPETAAQNSNVATDVPAHTHAAQAAATPLTPEASFPAHVHAAAGAAVRVETADVATAPSSAASMGNNAPATDISSLADKNTPDATVSTARLLQRLSETEMQVGLHSTEFGNIALRTSLAHEQLTAHISFERGELGKALSDQLPGLQAKLGNDHGINARIVIEERGAGLSSGLDYRSGQQQQQQWKSASVAIPFSTELPENFIATTPAAITPSDRLDVRV